MLDPVREAFVREYQKHGNATEALRVAKPHARKWKENVQNSKASTMLAEGKVQERLAQLQQKSAEKHGITVERLTEMTLKAYDMAQTPGVSSGQAQTRSMVKAAEFLGKLHGLIVDKSEITGADGAPLVPVLNVSVARNKP